MTRFHSTAVQIYIYNIQCIINNWHSFVPDCEGESFVYISTQSLGYDRKCVVFITDRCLYKVFVIAVLYCMIMIN